MKKKLKAIERKLKQILDVTDMLKDTLRPRRSDPFKSECTLGTIEVLLTQLLDDVRDWIDQGAWDEQD